MKIGAVTFPTEHSMDVVELGRELEQRGYESLFVTEHTNIPTSRRTEWPGGGPIPEYYKQILDPFVVLTAVAATTTRLNVGTGVCLVTQHDPVVLAKQVSTLDRLSGGRFLFGVGAGWNEDEMENHGTDPRTRWKLLRERVEAMRELWTKDVAEYHGELVDVQATWQWPKPLQFPHPPVLLGASTPRAMARAARYCDGWMPLTERFGDGFLDAVAELRRLCAENGRAAPIVMSYGLPRDEATIERWREAGLVRSLALLPSEPRDAVLRELEQLQPLVDRLNR